MSATGPDCTAMNAAALALLPIVKEHHADLGLALQTLGAALEAPERGAYGVLIPCGGPRGLDLARATAKRLVRSLDHLAATIDPATFR